ncbi:hypothetical protein ACP275_08G106400 [Erythranthe tilingii]
MQIATNVAVPDPQASYWVWRVDPAFRAQERERRCFSPLWVAFLILIGGLLLDVLISVTLGGGTVLPGFFWLGWWWYDGRREEEDTIFFFFFFFFLFFKD